MLPVPSVRAIGQLERVRHAGHAGRAPEQRVDATSRSAASVPIEISVSMVAVPCRRLVHAAWWNGHAPQTTTGAASVSDSHCQLVNCSAGIIAIAITGTVSTSEISSRWRSDAVGSVPRGVASLPARQACSGLGSSAV